MALTHNVPTGRFGIKEVADVYFFDVVDSVETVQDAISTYVDGEAAPAIVFDTLKVSNIESTAENSEARGGKGNAALISWDYGREVTVTLEDALLSMQTLSLLFEDNPAGTDNIIINANKFPGTYAVIGTTFARDEVTGKDRLFKFVIPKAKIQSETTLTMEAEGDPSVIGMTLKVLRTKSGEMMGLVRDEDYISDTTTTGNKVMVTLISTEGEVSTYRLTAGGNWPSNVTTTNYTDMPDTVVGGTYYAKA